MIRLTLIAAALVIASATVTTSRASAEDTPTLVLSGLGTAILVDLAMLEGRFSLLEVPEEGEAPVLPSVAQMSLVDLLGDGVYLDAPELDAFGNIDAEVRFQVKPNLGHRGAQLRALFTF